MPFYHGGNSQADNRVILSQWRMETILTVFGAEP